MVYMLPEFSRPCHMLWFPLCLTVDLPKKHGRGGQSALRFARLRMEKRHNYVRKVRTAFTFLACQLHPQLHAFPTVAWSGHSGGGWWWGGGAEKTPSWQGASDANDNSVNDGATKCAKPQQATLLLLLQVAELATQMYITNDRPNVSGLVLSGSADFKTELSQSDLFDPRLQAVVLGVVDVSYGE
jgi:hypothetical protein